MENKNAKLVGIEVVVRVAVPNMEAASAVKALFNVATQSIACQGWGGGSFKASLIYDAPVNESTAAPVAHNSHLN